MYSLHLHYILSYHHYILSFYTMTVLSYIIKVFCFTFCQPKPVFRFNYSIHLLFNVIELVFCRTIWTIINEQCLLLVLITHRLIVTYILFCFEVSILHQFSWFFITCLLYYGGSLQWSFFLLWLVKTLYIPEHSMSLFITRVFVCCYTSL